MSLPDSWVEKLFARLAVRYGTAFLRQYGDVQTAAIKADWALALADFERVPKAIEWALQNLPEAPPNASQFLKLCRSAPGDDRKPFEALPAPPANPERVREALQSLRSRQAAAATSAKAVAERLREIEASGRPLTLAQREMLKACDVQQFDEPACMPGSPIPRERWPWVAREAQA